MLSPDEVVHGYIGSRALHREFETPYFAEPENFSGIGTLSFNATGADDLSTAQRKARLRRWQEAFPSLSARYLVLAGRHLDQETFDCAVQVKGLEILIVYQSQINCIDAIADASNLLGVQLKSSKAIRSYDPLSGLAKIKSIVLDNPKNIKNLNFLQKIPQLEDFSLRHHADKRLVLDSLLPLKSLNYLQRVELMGDFHMLHSGLSPLYGLSMLENARISYDFKASEYAELRERTPSLWCGSPFDLESIAEFAAAERKVLSS